MSRDLSPKGYKISIELEGYPTFNKSIIIRDQEDYPIFVNFNNSKILVESEKNTDELKLSSFVQEENKTENATNVTTQIPSEMTKDSSLFFPATLVVIVLVLVFVLFNRYRAKGRNVTVADASEDANEKDDRSTEDKILDLLTTKGIANIVGRDERTVQKIFKKLREENRFPF